MGRLSATVVKAATRPGRLSDGKGFYLVIKPDGGKSWPGWDPVLENLRASFTKFVLSAST